MLVVYQDILISVHAINVLIGFADRRLFCRSDDLLETFNSSGSHYCTFSSIHKTETLVIFVLSHDDIIILAVNARKLFGKLVNNYWPI